MCRELQGSAPQLHDTCSPCFASGEFVSPLWAPGFLSVQELNDTHLWTYPITIKSVMTVEAVMEAEPRLRFLAPSPRPPLLLGT